MAERANFRQPTQDADVPVIGAFGGLSSATYSTTGDVVYAEKLVNAYVTKRNEIVRRKGSSIMASVADLSPAAAALVSSHAFTFDNRKYLVVREGYNLRLIALSASGLSVASLLKTNIFATAAVEKATFTTVVEDNTCFVICCSKSTAPVILTIVKRDVFVQSQSNSTTFTLVMSNYPSGNVLDANKVFLFDNTNTLVPVSTLSQALFNLNFVSAVPFTQTGNTGSRVHMVFACQSVSAAYYPGLYLYNTAIRKNLVPLDVNVAVPAELVSNPIINEPGLQDLTINSLEVYKTNNSPATTYTRVFNQQPTTVDSFDFSDGSYRVDPTIRTVRTPSFISFGALQSPTTDTRAFMFRWRNTSTVLPNYTVARSLFRVYVDKVLTTVLTYASNGAAVTDDSSSAFYFSMASATNPGINLSAVVETMYRLANTINNPVVDLTESQSTITIDDRYLFPIYGLSAIADVGGSVFPTLVQTVGNRVVLSGVSNKILISNSDWSYRGISWNNFQVSTIEFSATSAYLLSLTQSVSIVKGVISVSGVIFVATDAGIYRVSGASANAPPNATVANVSRVSNEVVAGQSALAIYNNQIFYTSANGFYSLEFNRENEEINAKPLSVEVSDYFSRFTATDLTYSPYYRAFLMSFAESPVILAYMLESESFTTFRLSTSSMVKITPTIDGYQMTANTTDVNKHILFCKWDDSLTDLSNSASALPSLSSVAAIVQTFTEANQANTLVTPGELVDTLNTNLRQSYGADNVRAIKGNVAVAEGTTTNSPLPIISALVTKAFASGKLSGSNRIRMLNLLLTGEGVARVKIVYQAVDYNDREPNISTVVLGTNNGYQGESFLNYQYAEQNSVGDNTNVRLRMMGISEAWAVAIAFDNTISLLGLQLDTAAKSRKRLH